ncbi:MAG: VCBS repeat-containing protein [Chloroflexi bacterium]|nr:MAG: VCBS repeat-containing protein [Chloroflexota bacterium]
MSLHRPNALDLRGRPDLTGTLPWELVGETRVSGLVLPRPRREFHDPERRPREHGRLNRRRSAVIRHSARRSWLVAVILTFGLMLPGSAAAQAVSFVGRRDFPVGSCPQAVAIGDFNADGVPDLVLPSCSSDAVTVLLGYGDGTFREAGSFPAGREPSSVAVGDFNRDGVPDLAVPSSGSDSVAVLLGNGDATFRPAVSFAAGGAPHAVAVADLDGDGLLDLAVANYGSGDVSVLLGNGDGTFRPARTFAVGTNPISIVVGDFNGDERRWL